jgi:hypothetical protein
VWADVIRTCYHPLLDLIKKTGIPIGTELTGWTLKQIEQIDIAWVERFKALINTEICELIDSVRIGVITLLNKFSHKNTKLPYSNGGENNEIFDLSGEINHIKPASILTSLSVGLGRASGKIQIINNGKGINLQWDSIKKAYNK